MEIEDVIARAEALLAFMDRDAAVEILESTGVESGIAYLAVAAAGVGVAS